MAILKEVNDYGFEAKGVKFRQIKKKLWEMKLATSSGGVRLFYAVVSGNRLLILHGFKKKESKNTFEGIKNS